MANTVYTWPNLITAIRIVMIVPVISLIHAGATQPPLLWLALGLMLICELSDWLDGYLARRMHWISSSGKVLDPMADSLYRISVFAALVANGWMPLWILLIMAARDLMMSEARLLAQRSSITLAARPIGKVRAALQGVAQVAIVFLYALGGATVTAQPAMIITALLYLATAVTLWSIADYARGLSAALRQSAAYRA